MTFGEKLQALRQRSGMSQDALAERLDVSRQAVSRWERDETMPETDKVVALADIFGVTTDYLLRPEVERQTPPAEGHPPRSGPTQTQRDTISRLGYLVKTKGYLLGWVLIAWGALDLLALALMGLGVLNFIFW
jgi:transcriptional regulator with XRE-family HTH domain